MKTVIVGCRKTFIRLKVLRGTSLAVQWLGLCAFTAEGAGFDRYLVRELRSHRPCGTVKQNKTQKLKGVYSKSAMIGMKLEESIHRGPL